MKKNLLEMKRNIFSTLCEVLFPIILMLLFLWMKSAFDITVYEFDTQEKNLTNFISTHSSSNIDSNSITPNLNWYGMSILPALKICSIFNSKHSIRPSIATIGIPDSIKQQIITDSQIFINIFPIYNMSSFKNFNSIDEMNNYIKSNLYGESEEYPLICFGMSLESDVNNHKYNYSLHYFENSISDGAADVPKSKYLIDQFQSGPDMTSFDTYKESGYPYIMKLISDYILSQEINNNTEIIPKINFGIIPMKYKNYRTDPFSTVIGFLGPFFIIIAYMGHLCIYVYRMVLEKETKVKEGMKIMGLTDGIYFLSYFIQYTVISLVDSSINAYVFLYIFTRVPYIVFFLIFFLFSLNVFALAYFFQSFIDKAKESLILSILIYFVMFFLSLLVTSEDASRIMKIILSIFPPVTIYIGIILLGTFESHFRNFYIKDIMYTFTNYSVFIMFIMLIADLLLYLFLGYYLQNVLPHDFGVRKKWYFIFTPSYWGCCVKNNHKKNNLNISMVEVNTNTENFIEKNEEENLDNDINTNINNNISNNFQSEDLYKNMTGPCDALRLNQVVKKFDDGKIAVNHVNLNFYKNEIFALLGHNGAGKTTLISILTGLYESSEGNAYYDNMDILESSNIEKFRQKIGICPQHDVLFNDLNIKEHLSLFAIFKGVKSENLNEEIKKIIQDFQLEDVQYTIAKNLSAGQRRKLSIAISLVGGSEIIFLDEPSSGMDITSRRNLWEILKKQSDNKIIILTTHYMEEASVLGKRIGIINLGKMKCIGTPLFLIEKFGKYMSLTLSKDENADNNKIMDFIKEIFDNVQFESLSEEIIVRIPKNNFTEENCSVNQFFETIDNNLENLNIKSYTVSMPTLEDVFLNVASEDDSQRVSEIIANQQKKDESLLDMNYMENFKKKSKFCSDFLANFKRRWFLTLRDKKGFIMEILCPIILVLIGSIISQVNFDYSTPIFTTKDISSIGKQNIYYAGIDNNTINNINEYYINNLTNITSNYLEGFNENISDISDKTIIIQKFIDYIYDKTINSESTSDNEIDMNSENYTGYYANLLLLNEPNENNSNYEFVELLNSRVVHGTPLYTSAFLSKIINKYSGHDVEINYSHQVMKKTAKQEMSGGSSGTVVLFVAIAFALIPANFITIIVREKNNNSKHLMKLAGVNILSYWLVNFLFELIKYYFTGGICILILYLFDYYNDYLYIFYLLYGPPLVALTYVTSYLFSDESSAQNKMILLNSLIGALGSSVIIVLRGLSKTEKIGKILEYIMCLLPSFAFCFSYNFSFYKISIYLIDYPKEWIFFNDEDNIKRFNLLLGPIIFLGSETVVYILLLFFIEYFSNNSICNKQKTMTSVKNVNKDIGVIKEEIRARENIKDADTFINSNNNNENNEKTSLAEIYTDNSNQGNFVIRIKNLRKIYSNHIYKLFCCCEKKGKIALKDLNFCLEEGECFGLLGLNGAGKTTTFKCITHEINKTNGNIYINGEESSKNFNKIKNIFGYCPQYDAIFEYLTVYENLEFYAKLKGVKKEYINQIVNNIIYEMCLEEFINKLSGKLSGGNKRKLSVAISMLCNPEIILLDEPSTGMDPEARRFMWSIIHKLSTGKKKSSVIMTTHSMDEAETLCKRMGIMVNGEFVCLGKANEIKDKYGYGYELNLRIKPLNKKLENEMFYEKYENINENIIVTKNNYENILNLIGRENYIYEMEDNRLGEKIMKDINKSNGIKISVLLDWIFFVENAIKFVSFGKNNFERVVIEEHMENNFLFKMKKKENENNKSIGYLFGLFDIHKDECYITEYSIQQTSLEQIFNKFAENQYSTLAERSSTIVEPGDVENISMSASERKKYVRSNKIIVTDELIEKLIKN